MRKIHYITLAAAIAIIALLYWGGNTIPPREKVASSMQRPSGGDSPRDPGTMKPSSFDSILSAARLQLSKTVADSVKTIENNIAAMRDSSRMAASFKSLAGVWQRSRQYPVSVFYTAKAAKLENSEKSLTFAGQLFLELLENESDRSLQLWEASQAISCLEPVLEKDSANEDARLALAAAYIQGTAEPMKGVQMLLAITRENPTDIPANMLLGRMSIQSGQFEKAIKRFETVLEQEPENKEALYFLAQAYEGAGNKQKAVELLEKVKKVVNNPDFSREIDGHIKSLK